MNFYPPTHPTHPFTRGWIRKAKHRKQRTHAHKNAPNHSRSHNRSLPRRSSPTVRGGTASTSTLCRARPRAGPRACPRAPTPTRWAWVPWTKKNTKKKNKKRQEQKQNKNITKVDWTDMSAQGRAPPPPSGPKGSERSAYPLGLPFGMCGSGLVAR